MICRKKSLSLVLVFALMLGVFIITPVVNAQGTTPDFTYTLEEDNSVTIVECLNLGASITIPSTIDGKTVKKIADYAFAACPLKTVSIPSTITEIGDLAFYECKSLTSVTIPSSVVKIGILAFTECTSLATITVGNSDMLLGYNVFDNTAWINKQPSGIAYLGKIAYSYKGTMSKNASISLKNDTVSIAPYAFVSQTNLAKITLPSTLKRIGDSAFSGCTSLAAVTIPNNVHTVDEFAFYDCNSLYDIKLGTGLKKVGTGAFDSTQWMSSQPSGLLYYGTTLYGYNYEYSFTDKSVTVKSGTEYIAGFAFAFAENLKSVSIPGTVKEIGSYVFYFCGALTTVNLPDSITDIGEGAFESCSSLTSVTLPQKLKKVNPDTFLDCDNLATISIPATVMNIGEDAFTGTRWLMNQPYDSVIYAGKVAYTYNGYAPATVTIKAGTLAVAEYAFYDQPNLVSVVLPNGLKKVNSGAFLECPKLRNILVPSSVTDFGIHSLTPTEESWKKMTIYCESGSVAEGLAKALEVNYSIVTPGAVTSVTGTATSASIALKWNKVNDASGYYIFRVDDSSGSQYTQVNKITSGDTVTWTDAGIVTGRSYIYKVYAYKTSLGVEFSGTEKLSAAFKAEATVTTLPPTEPPTVVIDPGNEYFMLGDANGDKAVTLKDVTLIQKYLAKIAAKSALQYTASDVNGDKNVDLKDATHIQKWLAGNFTPCPIGKWFGTEPSSATI